MYSVTQRSLPGFDSQSAEISAHLQELHWTTRPTAVAKFGCVSLFIILQEPTPPPVFPEH